ncbi:PASTA domain-containing protein [Enterococcus faecium]|uniref:PASTA domain-containing protein n=1 Tax=Enterococcus TaxID=1350 RepID=UPI00064C6D4A|nr:MULTISPECIES: PASTA domain-containing protein [Enterococcus]EGO9940322.1 PASTA domain-containing protein [Enterococcus faecium]EGP5192441.1 PASTA domain-containing protein [Enterococcus faecium]MCA6733681.1 PASTA domain-containing protein [Enterococcus lactis]MCA6736202.1 PASTA domain-containing protein [Enterococcus lactis]MCA6738748.1 PASTA domain-containing protein [Enterococcus lactis]
MVNWNTVGKVAKVTAKALVNNSKVQDFGMNIAQNAMNKKDSNKIKMPNLIDVSVEDAIKIASKKELHGVKILATPKSSYANLSKNMVVYTDPKPNKTVKDLIKLYYLDDKVIEQSKRLKQEELLAAKEREESKQKKKEDQKVAMKKNVDKSKNIFQTGIKKVNTTGKSMTSVLKKNNKKKK